MRKFLTLVTVTVAMATVLSAAPANAAPASAGVPHAAARKFCFLGFGSCGMSYDDKLKAVIKHVRTNDAAAKAYLVAFTAERNVGFSKVGNRNLSDRLRAVGMTKRLRDLAADILSREINANAKTREATKLLIGQAMPGDLTLKGVALSFACDKAVSKLVDGTLRNKALAAASFVLYANSQSQMLSLVTMAEAGLGRGR